MASSELDGKNKQENIRTLVIRNVGPIDDKK